LNEADGVFHALTRVLLTVKNGNGRRHAGTDEPGFIAALQNGDYLKVAKDPVLELEAIVGVEPLAGGDEAKVSLSLKERQTVRPEVAV
jgi:hypothetical protein